MGLTDIKSKNRKETEAQRREAIINNKTSDRTLRNPFACFIQGFKDGLNGIDYDKLRHEKAEQMKEELIERQRQEKEIYRQEELKRKRKIFRGPNYVCEHCGINPCICGLT